MPGYGRRRRPNPEPTHFTEVICTRNLGKIKSVVRIALPQPMTPEEIEDWAKTNPPPNGGFELEGYVPE